MNTDFKKKEAEKIILSCLGQNGVWASPYRYKYQCWTRDFVISAMDLLLESGKKEIVRRHLEELSKRQKPNGQIPIMFLDRVLSWLFIKIKNSIRERRMSFLLRAYFSKDGVESLSPWTRDSEILFVLGVLSYVNRTGDQKFLYRRKDNLKDALKYVEATLVKDGLVYGADWRDTRHDLDDKFVLTNNCLLYRVYNLLSDEEKAEKLKKAINEKYWVGNYYRDYPSTDEWDTLGNALAILFGIASLDQAGLIFKKAEEFDTPFGYKLNSVTLPPKNSKEAELMKRINQYGVIWPFIHGFMILAALKIGRTEFAETQFAKWNKLPGFYEWYDPETGDGFGSPEQLWSAALYLRVRLAMNY